MANKNKNRGDEYQFPHDEYVTAEEDTQNTQQSDEDVFQDDDESEAETEPQHKRGLMERFPILQNKRVLIVVGVAVVAIIGFQIMKPKHSVQVIKQAQAPVPSQTIDLQQQQQNALLTKVNSLSQAASHSEDVQNQLAKEISELKTSLNNSANNNKATRQALLVLANQVQSLSDQLKKATAAPHGKKLPPSPVLTFHLRAMIPGRAWIMGSNGEADSVVVGDKIKNYGKVTALKANAGKVLTSSGKVIQYNESGN